MDHKILSREEMREVARGLRSAGKRIAFTNGCFDILHVGHIRTLRKARECGDVLVVGLNSDASVRRLKGEGRPLVPEAERAEVLAALEMVDYVVLFDEDTPARLIGEVMPQVLVKGADYRADEVAGRETVEKSGGSVVTVALVEGRSTTGLIRRLRGGGGA